jgi:hypothetical protein
VVETIVTIVACIGLVGLLSTVLGRLFTQRKGGSWIWHHSTIIGWCLIGAGVILILVGFVIDQRGNAMATKLGLGSLLLFAGLWMIW